MQKFNKIMAGFSKTIKQLEALTKQKKAERVMKKKAVNALEREIDSIKGEETAAFEVSVKMKEVFQPTKGN